MDCVVAIIIRLRCILSFTQIYRQFLVDQRIPHKYRFNAPVLLCIYISYLYTHFVNLDIVLPLSILRNLHLKLYFIDRISSVFLILRAIDFLLLLLLFFIKKKNNVINKVSFQVVLQYLTLLIARYFLFPSWKTHLTVPRPIKKRI